MTGPSSPERCVIVLDQGLPPGLAANAAAVKPVRKPTGGPPLFS